MLRASTSMALGFSEAASRSDPVMPASKQLLAHEENSPCSIHAQTSTALHSMCGTSCSFTFVMSLCMHTRWEGAFASLAGAVA